MFVDHLIMSLLLALEIGIIGVYIASKSFDERFSPIISILLWFAVYDIIKVSGYIGFTDLESVALRSFLFSSNYEEGSIKYLIFNIFFIICMIFFNEKLPAVKWIPKVQLSRELCKISELLYIIVSIIVILVFLVKSDFNFMYMISARGGNESAKELMAKLSLLKVFSTYLVMIAPLYFYTREYGYITVGLCLTNMIVSYLITGSRGFMVYSIISILAIYYFNKKKLPTFNIVIFSFIFVIAFSALGHLRSSGSDSYFDAITAERSVDEGFSAYQLQLRDEFLFGMDANINYRFGETMLAPFFSFVPRDIMGDIKPKMIDGTIAVDYWGRDDIGLPVNLSTEYFINFGLLFFVPLGIFCFILKSMYTTFNDCKLYNYVMISLLVFSQTGLSSKLVFVFQTIIIFLLIVISSKLLQMLFLRSRC